MKLPHIFHLSRSIAVRLTWRVVGTMTIIFTFLSAMIFAVIWVVGVTFFTLLYISRMQVASEKINNVFSAVEVAVANNTPEVEENIGKTDRAFFAVDHLLRLNPNIMGAAVALDPKCEPMRGIPFAPYVYRDTLGIHDKMLSTPSYDYLHKEWFVEPIEQGKAMWSEPYVDVGGGEVMMTTYSLPLTNRKGEIYGVQTADLALDWIAGMMKNMRDSTASDFLASMNDLEGNSYGFIVTKKGQFIAHPDSSKVLNESIFDFFKKTPSVEDDSIAYHVLSGQQSMEQFIDQKGTWHFICYAPIKRTGWAMGFIMPVKSLFNPVTSFVKAFVIVFLIGLLIVVLVCTRTIHRVTKPLKRFADSADEIARGNIEAELPVIKTKDEMRRLHDSFETMQRSLVNQIEQIKKANEEKGRIEGELLIARNIQMSLIPKVFPAFPGRNDVDVYALLSPAKEVGGDLYDFHIRDEKLYFCIGDVSGKGIPASLVMSVTLALFRTASAHESSPGKILSGINELLAEDNDSNMFVTLLIGVLDLPTGRLRYSNAGHDAPILIDDKGVRMLPCDANLPTGVVQGCRFSNQEMVIEPQTMLFLYTDGLTEAENVWNEFFEEERILDIARNVKRDPVVLINQMADSVHLFVGDAEPSDDLTMMAIHYTKQQEQQTIMKRSITLSNDVEQVPLLAEFIEEVCEMVGVGMEDVMGINLAVEEVVVNVMSYAYPVNTKGNVVIDAMASEDQLKIIISDWGKPFDPTTKSEIDTNLAAEERPIGGLGIHLVRQIMDSINYERTDDKNVLTLLKKINT